MNAHMLAVVHLPENKQLTAVDDDYEAAHTPHLWTFWYHGPIIGKDVRTCSYCTAIAEKKCQKTPAQHGSDTSSCPECQMASRTAAGERVICPNHCGLETALAAHTARGAPYRAFVEFARAYVKSQPKHLTHVRVSASAEYGQPEAPPAQGEMIWSFYEG